MHPVANEVDIPIEQVERYLLQWAKPGYTGQREVHLRVLPEAGLKVEFIPTGNEINKVQPFKPSSTPPWDSSAPTQRELAVGAILNQNRHRFRIGTKLTRIVAHFVDGQLKELDWGTVG